MAVKDSIPSIPPVPASTDASLRPMLQAIRDALMVRAHQTKNFWDHSPTMRELFDAGIINVRGGSNGSPLNIDRPTDDPGTGTGIQPTDIPPAPTGLVVAASPWFMILSWDSLEGDNSLLVSHTEIWWSTTNDRNTATVVGTSPGFAFSHTVEPDSTNYYWIRFVSEWGVKGPFNAIEGTEGIALPDPQTLLDILEGAISESELAAHLAARIDLIDAPIFGLVDGLAAEIAARQADIADLQQTIDNVASSVSANVFINKFETTDIGNWTLPADNEGPPTYSNTLVGTAEHLFDDQGGFATFTHSSPPPYEPNMYTETIRIPIPIPTGIAFSGVQLRIRIYAKQPVTDPSIEFAFAYAVDNDTQDNSGWQRYTPSTEWTKYEFTYNAPSNVTEQDQAYLCIWVDTSNTGKGLYFDNAVIDIDGSVQDLSGIATNAAAIQSLTVRVTEAEGLIESQSTQLTQLINAVYDPVSGNAALSTAFQALDSRVTAAEGDIQSIASATTSLQNKINDPETGLLANSQAIDLLQSEVTSQGGTINANSSRITSLESEIADPTTGLAANATAINGLTTRVTNAEGTISAHSGQLTALEATVNDPNTGVNANASAVSGLSTDVGALDGQVTALATQYDTIATTVGENTTAVQVVAASIDGLEGQYSVKIDANGNVAGFGLSNSSNVYNPALGHSQFWIAVDNFAVYNPGDPADIKLTFSVDTINGRVVMDGAFIANATIGGAAIKNAAIGTAHIANASVVSAHIVDGNITNAKIDNVIQSSSWNNTTKTGWRINKAGFIEASALRIYNGAGQIVLDAAGGIYESRIDNNQQTLANLGYTGSYNATTNRITSGATFPTGPVVGDLHYRTVDLKLYSFGLGGWSLIGSLNEGQFATLQGKLTAANIGTYIEALAVGTLYIAGNAVTVPQSGVNGNVTLSSTVGAWTTICTCSNVTMDAGQPVMVNACFELVMTNGTGQQLFQYRLLRDFAPIYTVASGQGSRVYNNESEMVAFNYKDIPGAGTHFYALQATKAQSGGATLKAYNCSITALGVKR